MSRKYVYEEVVKIIENLGYELIDKEYYNNAQKLTLKDKEGYLYFICLNGLMQNKSTSRFEKRNPYTIHNIKLWCKLNNKPFELIDNQVYKRNNVDLFWQCLKEDCKEIFKATWNYIFAEKNCPYCVGQRVGLSNCLATKNPEVAKEWHPIKNSNLNLTPYNVTVKSHKEVWWQCSKNPKHEWEARISSRTDNQGCPYCCGRYPTEDYNLLVCNPELASEWNHDKNKKKPEEYCPISSKHVWWKCKECEYKWYASISNRNNRNSGCPECSKSKGEKRCKEVFIAKNFIEILQEEYDKLIDKDYNTFFIPQKEFIGLIGLGGGLLSYDFYLPKYNLLIEFQGMQHEKFCKGFHLTKKDFEKQVKHDKFKKEYALAYKYNFLEIWYWEFDKIEEILTNYFNNLDNFNNKSEVI